MHITNEAHQIGGLFLCLRKMDKAHTTSWFGAASAVFGAWSLTEWMAVAGVVIALIGTFIKWREYKLKSDWMEFKKKNVDKLNISIDDEAAK